MDGYLIFMLVVMGLVLTGVILWAILYLIYVLVLVRPAKKGEIDPELLCDYTHRGLHGTNVPENSLKAFELACKAGLAIELDVQLSSDGEVMVFHDYSLKRMTGIDKNLCELDAKSLSQLRLSSYDEHIPTFREVLALIDGRVPVLVELKGENFDTALCPRVAEILNEYKGKYCIESFNPLLVRQMRRLMPDAVCGLLYTNAVKEKGKITFINVAVSLMMLNFLCKPRFIAYDERYRDASCVRLATKLYKAQKFVWTVRSQENLDLAHQLGECPIFEYIARK
jgi:glycerophosphoryl diester phosphodiesterase